MNACRMDDRGFRRSFVPMTVKIPPKQHRSALHTITRIDPSQARSLCQSPPSRESRTRILSGRYGEPGARSASAWRVAFCMMLLMSLLLIAGCGVPLGSDDEVSNQDARLASEVKVALVRESRLNAASIDIQVHNGVVTLGGFVEQETQRKSAEQAAQNVPGVKSVVNHITVK